MSVDAKTHTGGCRCGALRFEAQEPRLFSGLCHCRNCRLGTSAPFSMIIGIPKNQFKWTQGEEHIKVYQFSEKFEGIYCGMCGGYTAQQPVGLPFVGSLAVVYDEVRNVFAPHEALGEFFRPDNHLNYENRVLDIPDSLPKFLDFPSQFGGSGKMFN